MCICRVSRTVEQRCQNHREIAQNGVKTVWFLGDSRVKSVKKQRFLQCSTVEHRGPDRLCSDTFSGSATLLPFFSQVLLRFCHSSATLFSGSTLCHYDRYSGVFSSNAAQESLNRYSGVFYVCTRIHHYFNVDRYSGVFYVCTRIHICLYTVRYSGVFD